MLECQDFSKILVVLGLQNSGGEGVGTPIRLMTKLIGLRRICRANVTRSVHAKILSRGEFIFGRRGRCALMLPVPFKLEFAKILSGGDSLLFLGGEGAA